MRVTIAIDDIHPEAGWGVEGDQCMEYLDELYKEFGAKFTLFIPSNYHNKAPLSQHRDWIKWLKSKGCFELAAHGHYHACERTDIGECEFFELDNSQKASQRLDELFNEWNLAGHTPVGWRNPGWLSHSAAISELGKRFKYAAIHYEHNHNIPWHCKTFYGHDGIQTTEITLHNTDMIMFQSHIAGDWNDNVWNGNNYNQIRLSLQHLTLNYDVEFNTLEECL